MRAKDRAIKRAENNDLYRTTLHESCHVIVASALGIPISIVTTIPNKVAAGTTTYDIDPDRILNNPLYEDGAKRRAICSAAGIVISESFHDSSTCTSGGDYEMMWFCIDKIWDHDKSVDKISIKKEVISEARKIIKRHWNLVVRFSELLHKNVSVKNVPANIDKLERFLEGCND